MNHFHDLLICRDGLFYFSRGPTCVCAHIYIYIYYASVYIHYIYIQNAQGGSVFY